MSTKTHDPLCRPWSREMRLHGNGTIGPVCDCGYIEYVRTVERDRILKQLPFLRCMKRDHPSTSVRECNHDYCSLDLMDVYLVVRGSRYLPHHEVLCPLQECSEEWMLHNGGGGDVRCKGCEHGECRCTCG